MCKSAKVSANILIYFAFEAIQGKKKIAQTTRMFAICRIRGIHPRGVCAITLRNRS